MEGVVPALLSSACPQISGAVIHCCWRAASITQPHGSQQRSSLEPHLLILPLGVGLHHDGAPSPYANAAIMDDSSPDDDVEVEGVIQPNVADAACN